MPRLRSIISLVLVLVTTLLVSCSGPQATIPTVYSPQKIEQLQVYIQPIEGFRQKMSVLQDLIADKNWVIDHLKTGKTLHPTPYTPHPAPTKNFFSKPYLRLSTKNSHLITDN